MSSTASRNSRLKWAQVNNIICFAVRCILICDHFRHTALGVWRRGQSGADDEGLGGGGG